MKNNNKIDVGICLCDKVIVHETPSNDSSIIDVICKSDPFYILNTISENDKIIWLKVETQAKYKGYINGKVDYKIKGAKTYHNELHTIKYLLLIFFIFFIISLLRDHSNISISDKINKYLYDLIFYIIVIGFTFLSFKGIIKLKRKIRLKRIVKSRDEEKI